MVSAIMEDAVLPTGAQINVTPLNRTDTARVAVESPEIAKNQPSGDKNHFSRVLSSILNGKQLKERQSTSGSGESKKDTPVKLTGRKGKTGKLLVGLQTGDVDEAISALRSAQIELESGLRESIGVGGARAPGSGLAGLGEIVDQLTGDDRKNRSLRPKEAGEIKLQSLTHDDQVSGGGDALLAGTNHERIDLESTLSSQSSLRDTSDRSTGEVLDGFNREGISVVVSQDGSISDARSLESGASSNPDPNPSGMKIVDLRTSHVRGEAFSDSAVKGDAAEGLQNSDVSGNAAGGDGSKDDVSGYEAGQSERGLRAFQTAGDNSATLFRTEAADRGDGVARSFASHLRENLSPEIVKQSSIILRDNNSGEIRLTLRPEQLGSVRIRISMTDNQLTGRIIVDNAAAKEAFDQNLETLHRAFREGGFETSSLDVTVGGSGGRSRGAEDQPQSGSRGWTNIEENVPLVVETARAEGIIDLVV